MRDFLVQGEFRAIIIGFNVSENGNHGFRTFIGQLPNDDGF
ncbi:hypothetical protein ACZ87_03822 [Candidatus Erwinia dacicola]|uniref:Uncharacterized protein n=1 Tax=Candidatus Erwinia dacicola TaxID=252393 RepID=A0A328TL64_9GAMM|nr:hypothetical protein ACZ87_03822 [Candidatus Erwinia dacicola]